MHPQLTSTPVVSTHNTPDTATQILSGSFGSTGTFSSANARIDAVQSSEKNDSEVYEYVLLSRMASYGESKYSSNNEHKEYEQFLKEKGWSRDAAIFANSEEKGCKKHGYFGVTYYKHLSDKKIWVVIAHRGTCLNIGNILADMALAEGKEPKILPEAAYMYVNYIHTQIGKMFRDFEIKITHTGFSLGGFIAAACCLNSDSNETNAVTFDAPGTSNLLIARNNVRNIVNYVTHPNFVNTANKHSGKVRQIKAFKREASGQEPNLSFILKFNEAKQDYITVFRHRYILGTLKDHSLDTIINSMKSNKNNCYYQDIEAWPSAEIEFIREPETALPQTKIYNIFSNETWLGVIGNGIPTIATQAYIITAKGLWDLTKIKESDIEIGVTGIKHTQKNNIIYDLVE